VSSDWWLDDDYRQNRRIKELQTEVNAAYTYAASRSRALQSRLSQVQGTLERRLDRLAKSFDAFVELSDLRLELAMFDRESDVRNRTRRLLMGLARGAENPPPLGLDDCPGYWLKPAAEALSALVRGDDEDGEKFAAQATERDADRTTLFLTLGLAVAGRYAEAVPWLARALPALGSNVTTVQRRLWIACADGAFGEPGREHIERRLTELIDEMPDNAAVEQRVMWGQAAAGGAPSTRSKSSLPRELQAEKSITEPPLAADSLTRLRTRVEAALRPADAEPAADFATLLNTLVDEGSPEEGPLVTRARELRQIIEMGGTEKSPAWDAPAGETLALLRADMFEKGVPGPRALAARVGGPWLTAVADGLLEQAVVRPTDRVDVRIHGRPLRIGTEGAPDLAEAQAAIDADAAASTGPVGEWLGLAMVLGGVVVMVLTILAGLIGLTVLGGLLTVAGIGIWLKIRADHTRTRDAADHDKERLAWQVNGIAEALKNSHTRHKELTTTAQADREAILTLLT
jgi:hypothetical protein